MHQPCPHIYHIDKAPCAAKQSLCITRSRNSSSFPKLIAPTISNTKNNIFWESNFWELWCRLVDEAGSIRQQEKNSRC
ncbi:hypothetical protein HanXRQr2_Chr10g0439781 [Helianthus annuus]|uniref:Uncharacterized protein n=1 Tax=Helianthus annuus TaxID=4232 RepID=A0A9K3HY44_HELAN|nr:hypothetical protein HanXRQr2_Chr10g0439781 [Helianthus annuus]